MNRDIISVKINIINIITIININTNTVQEI